MTLELSVWDETMHSLTAARFDLDDYEDKQRFIELYGEDLFLRCVHLCPSEMIRIKCISRWDGD